MAPLVKLDNQDYDNILYHSDWREPIHGVKPVKHPAKFSKNIQLVVKININQAFIKKIEIFEVRIMGIKQPITE